MLLHSGDEQAVSDGTDSTEIVRVEASEPNRLSLNDVLSPSSSSRSSGAESSTSKGPPSDMLSSFSGTCCLSMTSSSVSPSSFSCTLRRSLAFRVFLGRGIAVLVRRAWMDGGIACGLCTSRGRVRAWRFFDRRCSVLELGILRGTAGMLCLVMAVVGGLVGSINLVSPPPLDLAIVEVTTVCVSGTRTGGWLSCRLYSYLCVKAMMGTRECRSEDLRWKKR